MTSFYQWNMSRSDMYNFLADGLQAFVWFILPLKLLVESPSAWVIEKLQQIAPQWHVESVVWARNKDLLW